MWAIAQSTPMTPRKFDFGIDDPTPEPPALVPIVPVPLSSYSLSPLWKQIGMTSANYTLLSSAEMASEMARRQELGLLRMLSDPELLRMLSDPSKQPRQISVNHGYFDAGYDENGWIDQGSPD